MLAIESPFPQFFDMDGSPLDAGKLYFGQVSQNPETAPVTVYWDAALTQPAAQPIRTLNGYPVRSGTPAMVYADADYSLTIRDQRGRLIATAPNSAEYSLGSTVVNGLAAIRSDLANTSDATKGAGMSGFKRLAYAVDTVGWHALATIPVTDEFSQAQATDWTGGAPTLDHTTAFNAATLASSAYGASLYREVYAPGKTYKLGAGDTSVYVRKGQHLHGAGMGATVLDVSGTSANTKPTIMLGTSSSAAVDGGGQVAEVSELQFTGGPAAAANIDTRNCAGWSVHNNFFSGPGIGVYVSGADGQLSDCIFDVGLNHIIVGNGGNLQVSSCLFYLGNYQATISGAYDTTLTGCQFEYPQYASLLFSPGSQASSNVKVVGCNFLMNVQYGTFMGAVVISDTGVDAMVSSCTFRNLAGYAIKYQTGLNNKLTIEGCTFDGLKTASGYAQSTTMGGVDCSNVTTTISDSTFRNLPGQPILFGGAEAVTLIVDGCRFSGNTGGTTEILITNTNPASKVIIRNCTGSGRPLVNAQTVVPVSFDDTNFDGSTNDIVTISAATHAVSIANKFVGYNYAGTVTVTLPPASIYRGLELRLRTYTANAVVSASSNVVPLNSLVAGTAILAATAGKWATLVSDGSNWLITAGN